MDWNACVLLVCIINDLDNCNIQTHLYTSKIAWFGGNVYDNWTRRCVYKTTRFFCKTNCAIDGDGNRRPTRWPKHFGYARTAYSVCCRWKMPLSKDILGTDKSLNDYHLWIYCMRYDMKIKMCFFSLLLWLFFRCLKGKCLHLSGRSGSLGQLCGTNGRTVT